MPRMRRTVVTSDGGPRPLPVRVLPAALRARLGMSELRRAFDDRVHVEATPHLHYTLNLIRESGCAAGAALNPGTRADALSEVAGETLDLALCMSVNPGWGNQKLIPASIDKLARMRSALPEHVALEVDGGVHQKTVASVAGAGANLLVTGSAVFGSDDPAVAYREIAQAAGISLN